MTHRTQSGEPTPAPREFDPYAGEREDDVDLADVYDLGALVNARFPKLDHCELRHSEAEWEALQRLTVALMREREHQRRRRALPVLDSDAGGIRLDPEPEYGITEYLDAIGYVSPPKREG